MVFTPVSLIRVSVALLLAAHGWARLFAGGVVPFGDWLNSLGFPGGFWIAVAITGFEILGTAFLALDVFTVPVSLFYVVQLLAGIVLVHAPAGWFVVGLSRNGAEYSVLLVLCLVTVIWNAVTEKRKAGAEAAPAR
jgi:putative oxidoreductase